MTGALGVALVSRRVDSEPVLGRDVIDAGRRLDGACGIYLQVKIGKCSIDVYLSYPAYPSSNSREPISSSSPLSIPEKTQVALLLL